MEQQRPRGLVLFSSGGTLYVSLCSLCSLFYKCMWYCAAQTFRGARADSRPQCRHVTGRCASTVHGIRMISQSCDNKAQQVPGVCQAAERGRAHSPLCTASLQSTAQESGLPSEVTGIPLPCRCSRAPCSFLACTCCLRSAAIACRNDDISSRPWPPFGALWHSALCAAHSLYLPTVSPRASSTCTFTFAHALAFAFVHAAAAAVAQQVHDRC
jgi:hypothetical protein